MVKIISSSVKTVMGLCLLEEPISGRPTINSGGSLCLHSFILNTIKKADT